MPFLHAGRRTLLALAASLSLLTASPASAQSGELANPDPVVEARLKELAHELRCLVCQNQTIADSDAPLAVDLRKQIRTMISAGRSDDDIRAYMVERYGNFVLYRPPFNAATALLWAGPLLLMLVGVIVMVRVIRKRNLVVKPLPSSTRRRELDKLLAEDSPPPR